MQQRNKKIDFLCQKTGLLINSLRKEMTTKSLNMFAMENEIGRGNLSRLENGLNDPKLSTLKKIAEGLNIPLSEFIKKLENELPENWHLVSE